MPQVSSVTAPANQPSPHPCHYLWWLQEDELCSGVHCRGRPRGRFHRDPSWSHMDGLSQGDIRGDGQSLSPLQNDRLGKLQEPRGNTGAAAKQGENGM